MEKKVNIVGGKRCIKNKSRKRKREEEEKKATEKNINDAINYSISQSIYQRLETCMAYRHRVFPECG